jgi:hypothetical protein
MNEEEKKVVGDYKSKLDLYKYEKKIGLGRINIDEKIYEMEVIINVIERLQKENEEYSKQLDLDYVDKNYISKKKIEDTIEELKGKLEDISKRREKSKTKEEETVLWCLEIRTDERIKTLQELL